VEQTIQ